MPRRLERVGRVATVAADVVRRARSWDIRGDFIFVWRVMKRCVGWVLRVHFFTSLGLGTQNRHGS